MMSAPFNAGFPEIVRVFATFRREYFSEVIVLTMCKLSIEQ